MVRFFLRLLLLLLFFTCWGFPPSAFAATKIQVSYHGVPKAIQDSLVNSIDFNRYVKTSYSKRELKQINASGEKKIEAILNNMGYFDVVVSPNSKINSSGSLSISFSIYLNEPVKVAQFHWQIKGEGYQNPDVKDFLKQKGLLVGDVFNYIEYIKFKSHLILLLRDLGYLDAKFVVHQVKINKQEHQAIIKLQVDTGALYRINHIRIHQKRAVFDEAFLQRFIILKPHNSYTAKSMNYQNQRFSSTDYFSSIYLRPIIDRKLHQVDIVVNLRAKPYQSFLIGGGYELDLGPRLILGFDARRLGGKGNHFNLQLQAAKDLTSFQAAYVIPGKDPIKDQTSLDAGQSFIDITPYRSLSSIVGIRKIKSIGKWQLQAGVFEHFYHYSDYQSNNKSSFYFIPQFSASFNTKIYDSQTYWPSNFNSYLNAEVSPKFRYLSKQHFYNIETNQRLSFPLSANTRALLSFGGGALIHSDVYDLAAPLRFYAGGIGTVRGYAYKSLGPMIDGQLAGGEYLLHSNLDLEYHIYNNWIVSSFYDVGNAFNDIHGTKWYEGSGIGIGIRSSVATFLVYFSRPVGQDQNHRWRVDLSLGANL